MEVPRKIKIKTILLSSNPRSGYPKEMKQDIEEIYAFPYLLKHYQNRQNMPNNNLNVCKWISG